MEREARGLWSWIAGRRVVPAIPPGRAVRLESEDVAATSTRRDGTASLGLFLEYVDARGASSERRIACRSYDKSADTITAWCFEREALREFRVDRIVSAACTETGELFEIELLVARLRSRGLPLRDTNLNIALRILTFLMRCDGAHASEQEAIEDAIVAYALRFDGDDETVKQAMRVARTMAPDDGDFIRALRYLRIRPDRARLARYIRSNASRVIDADRRHSEQELYFGIELDQYLCDIERRG